MRLVSGGALVYVAVTELLTTEDRRDCRLRGIDLRYFDSREAQQDISIDLAEPV